MQLLSQLDDVEPQTKDVAERRCCVLSVCISWHALAVAWATAWTSLTPCVLASYTAAMPLAMVALCVPEPTNPFTVCASVVLSQCIVPATSCSVVHAVWFLGARIELSSQTFPITPRSKGCTADQWLLMQYQLTNAPDTSAGSLAPSSSAAPSPTLQADDVVSVRACNTTAFSGDPSQPGSACAYLLSLKDTVPLDDPFVCHVRAEDDIQSVPELLLEDASCSRVGGAFHLLNGASPGCLVRRSHCIAMP